MAAIIADRVQEITTTAGTGALTLGGAVAGFLTFGGVMAVGDTCRYCIVDGTANAWEVGTGTYSAASTLTRTTVESSSNANAAVSFAGTAGTVVFLTASAALLNRINSVPSMLSGRFYTTPGVLGNMTTVTYWTTCTPIIVQSTATVNSLSITTLSGNAASSCNVGIYSGTAAGPSVLLAQVNLPITSAAAVLTGTVNVPVAPGLYWLVVQTSATVSLLGILNPVTGNLTGYTSVGGLNNSGKYCMYTTATTYTGPGSLPATIDTSSVSTIYGSMAVAVFMGVA